jgi:hypothetical protein
MTELQGLIVSDAAEPADKSPKVEIAPVALAGHIEGPGEKLEEMGL